MGTKQEKKYLKDLTIEKFHQFIEDQDKLVDSELTYVEFITIQDKMKRELYDQIQKIMIKPSINYSKLVKNKVYKCLIQSCTSGRTVEEKLKYVKQDDCGWRTADDNSELANNWNVVKVLK